MRTKQLNNTPIGVFDSGLGGLTVLKSLEKILPNESFIYFGDTAHVPYGTKSAKMVTLYSQHIMDFFLKYKTKAVVIACNTASAVAFQHLKKNYDIPLFDVVTPSVEYSMKITKTRKIGVVGTYSTIQSHAYKRMFKDLGDVCSVQEISCPLFVPIIEEGWAETSIARDIAEIYLKDITSSDMDTLILGCTHYPIMAKTIKTLLPNKIQLVYSGESVGYTLAEYLKKKNCENSSDVSRSVQFFVTDYLRALLASNRITAAYRVAGMNPINHVL
mgnify:CR=1 FL=1